MSDHLSPERLAQIRERTNAATKGPWEVQGGDWAAISAGPDSVIHAYCKTEDCECGGDAEVSISSEDEVFIANARQDIPAILAHIDEQASALTNWQAVAFGYQATMDAQAATIQRVRDLCMDTDGNYIDNEAECNNVGTILNALDGGQE